MSQDAIELKAKVIQVLPATMFRVQLENNKVLLAHLSGKMRKNFIKIMEGDIVTVEVSPYDLTKARITYRHSASTSSELDDNYTTVVKHGRVGNRSRK